MECGKTENAYKSFIWKDCMKAEEIMTPRPQYIEANRSIREALEKMLEFDVRHLPVLRDSELVGMISDRDVRDFALPLTEEFDDLGDIHARLSSNVTEVMRTDLVTVSPQGDLAELVDLFIDEKLDAVAVVDPIEDGLIGIISYIDILKGVRDNI